LSCILERKGGIKEIDVKEGKTTGYGNDKLLDGKG
jgi:hypothetical protein